MGRDKEKAREYNRAYRQKNREKNREGERVRRAKNPEKNRNACRAWRTKNRAKHLAYIEKNREKRREYNRAYYARNSAKNRTENRTENRTKNCEKNRINRREYQSAYYKKNIEKRRDKRRESARKRNARPYVRLVNSQRRRLKQFIRSSSVSRSDMFGCTPAELVAHIESQFTRGMKWTNYGKWHIDHIMPCSAFDLSKPEQVKVCFNWQNLRPLWAKENMSKGKRITHPQLPLPLVITQQP